MEIKKEKYFNNASTMLYNEYGANPSTTYRESEAINNEIRLVKKKICDLFHCKENEIIFTSGASESNSLALQRPFQTVGNCHPSITKNPFRVDYSDYKATSYIESETGYINSLRRGIKHLDCTQGVWDLLFGVEFVEKDFLPWFGFDESDLNTLSFSGHKLGSQKGIGVLLVKEDFKKQLRPLIYGEQQYGLRGGTENVDGILSLGLALQNLTYENYVANRSSQYYLRDQLLKKIKNRKDCEILSTFSPTITVLNVGSLPDDGANMLKIMLEKDGYIVSTGSACHGDKSSVVYNNIFKNKGKTIRMSINRYNTKEVIDDFLKILFKDIERLCE